MTGWAREEEEEEEDGGAALESHDSLVSVAGRTGSRPKSSLPVLPLTSSEAAGGTAEASVTNHVPLLLLLPQGLWLQAQVG